MLKVSCCRATVALGLASVLAISASVFAQDKSSATSEPQKQVLSVGSIRPFMRSETPANQAPDLYDPKSDEFNYFREDLGRSETSSKTRARLAEHAARIVYVDPMDKPAADGTPFVNIYASDEVFTDGKPFVGEDDPDVYYKADENNFLSQFAKGSQILTTGVSKLLGVSSQNDFGSSGSQFGGSQTPMQPMHSMPTVSMDASVAPGGMATPMPGDLARDSKDGKSASSPKAVEPSANDDSKLLFPGEAVENPFKEPVAVDANGFDFFQEDRAFEPKAPAAQTNGGYMTGGYMGSMSPSGMPSGAGDGPH